MNVRGTAVRLLVGLASLAVLAGCASNASPSPAPASSSPDGNPSATLATKTKDVAYESANPLLKPGVLDVYAPAKAGPWPVVVMFHGAPQMVRKSDLHEYARKVADLGFVVFVPDWGHETAGGATSFTYEAQVAVNSQAACAVAFARAHAAEYGGDPATMIVFGRSGGANTGAMVAFGGPEPSAGCLGGAALGAIDALVTWEGSWVLSVPASWHDPALAADPRILDLMTPWAYLAEHEDLKVVMLVSEHPGADLDRRVSDPWAADSWLAVRDSSGDLRRQLEANGALADGTLAFTEVQQLLFSVLEAQGNPVSLDVMPGSTHDSLSGEGWDVLLAAFPKAAAKD